MAAALVSAIIQQLATIAAENARQEFRLVTGVETEVRNLESNFKAIQCVLEDAEERQLANKSVGYWLERLKQVSYDMEDVLDEWKFALQKLQTEADEVEEGSCVQMKKKVCNFFSCIPFCHQVARRHDIGAKIKEINQELDQIAKEKDRYQLATRTEMKQPRPESTSFVDVSKLHGRDVVKSKIISMLLGKDRSDGIRTISIVGMGGIGKTALAQMICNDDEVRAHFNKVIWVCVSDLFDQNKVARAILGGLDQDSTNLQNQNIPLQHVLEKVCEKIKSTRFLLVLDDVWTDHDEDWQQLRATFRRGMPGSRILVTTRKESVARGLGSSHDQILHLRQVSDEVCWLILSQVAFFGMDDDELRIRLEDVGRDIAKKCKGLPLAAKTLGGLLREKKNRSEWQNVLNSEVWALDFAKENIFKPLLLSYYDLPSNIRPCLLYCAVLPKDYEIRRTEIIKHWSAHGYLNSGIKRNSGMGEREEGEEYFNHLASRCFFQDFKEVGPNNPKIWSCKMHDIVHDFVQHLTTNEIVAVAVNRSEKLRLDSLSSSSSKKVCHLRLGLEKVDMDQSFHVSINDMEKLRSLITVGHGGISGEALQELFRASKRLRLLEFQLYGYHDYINVKEIPNEIGKLIHLRYLSLSYNGRLIRNLPEQVCELKNLQDLILDGCRSLEKLPDGIGKLTNLRTLTTDYCERLEYYPKGIGKLTLLRELCPVIVRVDGNKSNKELSIGDLESLDLLGGHLWIRMVGNVVDREEAKRAKLHKKRHLSRLIISTEGYAKQDLIQALNPPPSLSIWYTSRLHDGKAYQQDNK